MLNNVNMIQPTILFVFIICVFFKTIAVYLLAGAAIVGYFMYKQPQPAVKQQPAVVSPSVVDVIEETPVVEETKTIIASSLDYDQQPQYASIHHNFYDDQEDSDEYTLDSRSINTEKDDCIYDIGKHPLDTDPDFDYLLRFPACPTTLPRLDTQFNFKIDHHHEIKPPTLDWSAIHKELEYEQQRQEEEEQEDIYLPSYKDVFDDVLLVPPKPSISSQVFKHFRNKKKSVSPVPKPSASTVIKGKLNKLFTKKT